ncbi:hypothetical protein EMIHUDRAFT_99210 [Emiliania huxleyi CCMP1516]|uniref:Uncharacterized protein n=2 Tax=Emiliania huxleyi TaxID=2903 RepID=A0A0D3K586_EMIH1|nr:hypothetical protein EMIHUDRAFT_99210 [Emiliania huxleyi CCMP1516]EOD30921.1 hypothetical protein EMIHUDRAFT_99210 [Emiliania huxleyi CCMP1516]|eukprot:XP_005783350.1 hypothetical protein EMIHUDRAFT_99210 [Emiliania huxleyi CCMP1516]
MEDEDYVVAAAAGAAGTRGARRLRRDAVRHRAWRAERIGALGHRVAVRASATESGAEEDEAGAAFKWKWNIDGGELFEECLRRAKLEGHLPDLMRGCPFSGQTALTRSMLRALTLPYVTRALNGDFPGSDLKAAEEAHIASLDAYCRKHWAPTGQVANGRWPGGAGHGGARLSEAEGEPRTGRVESAASIAAAQMRANVRSYNAEEEKALRVCRIEFAPYPSGKYNKLEGEDGPGRVAAYEQCRKDLPALSSWSDDEIEATFTYMQSTPSELLFNSPIGPFLVLSGLSIWRDGMATWGIPPCKTYLDLCEALPTFQLNVMGS